MLARMEELVKLESKLQFHTLPFVFHCITCSFNCWKA